MERLGGMLEIVLLLERVLSAVVMIGLERLRGFVKAELERLMGVV